MRHGETSLTELLLVRHGESEANVAAADAGTAGALRIDVPARDADVRLSATGREQAAALGGRLGGLAAADAPDAAWVSPYLRAQETLAVALEHAGTSLPTVVDERLRDRELGILDTLTSRGVAELHPEEAARRRFLGKYYYRAPGGESWADVALRIRSVLRDLDDSGAARVLVVTHDAVITLFRSVCEGIAEPELLELAAANPIRNASLTRLVREPGDRLWRAAAVNDVEHLLGAGATVTEHPGAPDGPRP
jgi:broad specificity phosphatase PhoE